jgi:hypothetical protein
MEELVDITAAEVIGEYRLRLTFEDGTVGDVDFTDRDWRGVFEPLRDPRISPASRSIASREQSRGRMASTWRPNLCTPRRAGVVLLPPRAPAKDGHAAASR